MKSITIFSAFILSALFLFGPTFSLEARHHHHHRHNHFSVGFGPVISVAPRPYIIERSPAYIENRVYVDPYGYAYKERIYVEPARTCVYPSQPALFTGFSFGINFFR